VGYLSDIADSDKITEKLAEGRNIRLKRTPGMALAVSCAWEKLNLVGEYVTGLRDFNTSELYWKGHGAKLGLWQTEASYGFDFLKEFKLMLGYQWSDQAFALGSSDIPQKRILAGFGFDLVENTNLAFQYNNDEDYDRKICSADGATCGTGKRAYAYRAALTVKF